MITDKEILSLISILIIKTPITTKLHKYSLDINLSYYNFKLTIYSYILVDIPSI